MIVLLMVFIHHFTDHGFAGEELMVALDGTFLCSLVLTTHLIPCTNRYVINIDIKLVGAVEMPDGYPDGLSGVGT